MEINDNEIRTVEEVLLPKECSFGEDAIRVIKCWESAEVLACPGSGKTTVLLAKLKILSDKMPIEAGRGICVLSHTNVAVNEIKEKLGESAQKILGFPNYVGTLQTFVDRYITFPYLKQIVKAPIQVVDRKEYAIALHSLINVRYKKLASFLRLQYKNTYSSIYADIIDFVSALYADNGDLYIPTSGKPKKLAGSKSDSAKNYKFATVDLLVEQGMLKYEDCYSYTQKAIEIYGDNLRKILSNRFKYVFVDEYQDCSEMQRNILDNLFDGTDTIFQKIGDVDQAIYNGDENTSVDWCVSEGYLALSNSNRYGQEIADVLTKLRTDCNSIYSTKGELNIKPTLLVYDDNSRENVVGAFIQEIRDNKLDKENAIFKAVGMYKNVSGLKIGDYWKEFNTVKTQKEFRKYPDYILKLCIELQKGNLYIAEKIVRKLLCKICYILGKKNENPQYGAKEFNLSSMKKYLENEHGSTYKSSIIHLTELSCFDYDAVEAQIKSIIRLLFDDKSISEIPESFMKYGQDDNGNTSKDNRYKENEICIQFDTVFGVKGETHDATLYLETESRRGTDLKRIMPLLEGKKLKSTSAICEKSRRCVYVGFSRPKYLLCVAMCISTYQNHEKVFEDWKVIDLTQIK